MSTLLQFTVLLLINRLHILTTFPVFLFVCLFFFFLPEDVLRFRHLINARLSFISTTDFSNEHLAITQLSYDDADLSAHAEKLSRREDRTVRSLGSVIHETSLCLEIRG